MNGGGGIGVVGLVYVCKEVWKECIGEIGLVYVCNEVWVEGVV